MEIIRFYCAMRSLHLWYLWRMPEMDAPRALVFQPLVKGNEALGTRLGPVRALDPCRRSE